MSNLFSKSFLTTSPALPKVALLALAVANTGCNSNQTEAKQNQPTTSKTTSSFGVRCCRG